MARAIHAHPHAVALSQEALRTCVWGNFCGGSCDGTSEGKDPITGDGGLDQVRLLLPACVAAC